MFTKYILVVLMMIAIVVGSAVEDWGYEEDELDELGPSHWRDVYQMCGHGKQSPIDISSFSLNVNLEKFNFNGYNITPGVMTVRHDGHTIKVFPDVGMSISGGSLNYTYTFHHLHFHWGDNDSLGSEHTVSGKRYPLEVHFVHWNSDKYANISEATNMAEGLAVIGLLVGVDEDNSPKLNKVLGNLTEFFAVIHYAGNETKARPFRMIELLPMNHQYYRYEGSLTTPPCSETVTWTVLKDTVYITHDQAEEFRRFHEEHHPERELHHSNRPTQPANQRTVFLSPPYYSSQTINPSSNSGTLSTHVVLVLTLGVRILLSTICAV